MTNFSIDDAFEEEFNEARRVYSSTTTPNKPVDDDLKVRPANIDQSRDSDSLIHGLSDPNSVEVTATDSCFQHPRVRRNWRMILAATSLLIVGLLLLSLGVYAIVEPDSNMQATVFIVAGLICFIPGAYHVIYVFLAARGFRGYHFHNLPLFT